MVYNFDVEKRSASLFIEDMWGKVRVMVFSAIYKNITVISWNWKIPLREVFICQSKIFGVFVRSFFLMLIISVRDIYLFMHTEIQKCVTNLGRYLKTWK